MPSNTAWSLPKPRNDQLEARKALDAYLNAQVPTSSLTLGLCTALAQLLANDIGQRVGVRLGHIDLVLAREPDRAMTKVA